jgi:hypothetical protein
MRSIEPIKSIYGGRTFRSKLEAKAAAWLDKNGFNWIYEPDSFVCNGVIYTPDFYLPEIDTLIEVKPLVALGELKRIDDFIRNFNKSFLILSASDTGEIKMEKLWCYSGPCGWATGVPDTWCWHDKADFVVLEYMGKNWFAPNRCCLSVYNKNLHPCSCDK